MFLRLSDRLHYYYQWVENVTVIIQTDLYLSMSCSFLYTLWYFTIVKLGFLQSHKALPWSSVAKKLDSPLVLFPSPLSRWRLLTPGMQSYGRWSIHSTHIVHHSGWTSLFQFAWAFSGLDYESTAFQEITESQANQDNWSPWHLPCSDRTLIDPRNRMSPTHSF